MGIFSLFLQGHPSQGPPLNSIRKDLISKLCHILMFQADVDLGGISSTHHTLPSDPLKSPFGLMFRIYPPILPALRVLTHSKRERRMDRRTESLVPSKSEAWRSSSQRLQGPRIILCSPTLCPLGTWQQPCCLGPWALRQGVHTTRQEPPQTWPGVPTSVPMLG